MKDSIALSSAGSELMKLCFHSMTTSFQEQILRLTNAGFPNLVTARAYDKLLKKLRQFCGDRHNQAGASQRDAKRPVVLPYVHKLSHNLKNVARRYDVKVAFSAPNTLSKACKILRIIL